MWPAHAVQVSPLPVPSHVKFDSDPTHQEDHDICGMLQSSLAVARRSDMRKPTVYQQAEVPGSTQGLSHNK